MASSEASRAWKENGANLLTPHHRHVDASKGTLSARPDGARFKRRPLVEISTFRDGQQPKLRELIIVFCSLVAFFPERG